MVSKITKDEIDLLLGSGAIRKSEIADTIHYIGEDGLFYTETGLNAKLLSMIYFKQ